MQIPSILQGKRLFDLIKGGIAGAILITAVGFNWTGYGFGWTLRGTAEQMVIDAVVAAPKSVQIDTLAQATLRPDCDGLRSLKSCSISQQPGLFLGPRCSMRLSAGLERPVGPPHAMEIRAALPTASVALPHIDSAAAGFNNHK